MKAPLRYRSAKRSLSFRERLANFIRTWKWETTEIHYVPVHPGDAGYKFAPYELHIEHVEIPDLKIILKKKPVKR